MTRIYSTPNGPVAHLVRHALEAEGIAGDVRGETRAAFVGEIPPIEAWIEVWVADGDAVEADRIAREITAEVPEGEPWTCACGESVESVFATCWSCGAAAPEEV